MNSRPTVVGTIVSVWRYPVKSMMGEELNVSEVSERGLLGDRSYALIDSSDGKVASAKNPRKWPRLFDFRAALAKVPRVATDLPPVHITLPDGTMVDSDQPSLNRILSQALAREVTLGAIAPVAKQLVDPASPAFRNLKSENYWPDIEGLEHRDTIRDYGLPEGTFFDAASVHLLTTATLDRLRMLYPQGRFEARRFRPNMVVQTAQGLEDFVENAWVGHTLAIGDSIRLSITRLCARCVMTTLPQGDLPNDPGILRTAARHNQASVGVYASVLQGGVVRRGDAVRLD
jgi:hypothetical protein